ncbi:MAG: Smr/MutS family protein [Gemmatimonadaceae bacterium]|nr:Smr/MutS family protein [Gemmatimonadaceae bacterium]
MSDALLRAFDAAAFGAARTLDVRSSLPTAAEAQARVESWVRQQQLTGTAELLIITGRGAGSEDGVAVVRPAVERTLAALKRKGVVAQVREHTPGSFVVTPASLTALSEAIPRRKDPPVRRRPVALATLAPETRDALAALAGRQLALLGAPVSETNLEDEMHRQFSALVPNVAASADPEAALAAAARDALAALDDAP